MPKIVEVNIKRKVKCSRDVAFWNHWDHEHLDVIHSGYSKSNILYEKNNFLFRIDEIHLPIFSFIKVQTPIFQVQHDDETLITYAIQFGILSKTTIKIKEIDKTTSEINSNYQFFLKGWKRIFEPMLKIMIPIWNARVWREDLPVKLRRQKVIDMNFVDFVGLPNNVNDRMKNKNYKLSLPIPRPKNSTRDKHPLKF